GEVEVRDPDARRRGTEEERSVRLRLRSTAAVGVSSARHHALSVARRRMDERAAAAEQVVRASDDDLRGASRIVGPRARGGQSLPLVPRAGAPPRAVREGSRLHAYRAAAGDGASIFGIVGLSGPRFLRADHTLRAG